MLLFDDTIPSLFIENTQKAWQRSNPCVLKMYNFMSNSSELAIRTTTLPGYPVMLLWLAYANDKRKDITYCVNHQKHPLRDAQLCRHKIKFTFGHCTGRCFTNPQQLCVVVAEWSGTSVSRWGFVKGKFRDGHQDINYGASLTPVLSSPSTLREEILKLRQVNTSLLADNARLKREKYELEVELERQKKRAKTSVNEEGSEIPLFESRFPDWTLIEW